MKYLYITSKKASIGGVPVWRLRDQRGKMVGDEGRAYYSRADALKAVEIMYPAGSVWQGERVSTGWKIVID